MTDETADDPDVAPAGAPVPEVVVVMERMAKVLAVMPWNRRVA